MLVQFIYLLSRRDYKLSQLVQILLNGVVVHLLLIPKINCIIWVETILKQKKRQTELIGYGIFKSCLCFDPLAPVDSRISNIADMNYARYRHSLVAANGKLYAVGGSSSDYPALCKAIEEYDPAHPNKWKVVSYLPIEPIANYPERDTECADPCSSIGTAVEKWGTILYEASKPKSSIENVNAQNVDSAARTVVNACEAAAGNANSLSNAFSNANLNNESDLGISVQEKKEYSEYGELNINTMLHYLSKLYPKKLKKWKKNKVRSKLEDLIDMNNEYNAVLRTELYDINGSYKAAGGDFNYMTDAEIDEIKTRQNLREPKDDFKWKEQCDTSDYYLKNIITKGTTQLLEEASINSNHMLSKLFEVLEEVKKLLNQDGKTCTIIRNDMRRQSKLTEEEKLAKKNKEIEFFLPSKIGDFLENTQAGKSDWENIAFKYYS
ncbi:hypothetical protein WR25_17384 isoform B [Diploscapter pachys]|uniref:Uncharacterized protein n=1 Tax=Diploscapter pachys TaxID=2018661 RepID=A0A2A2JDZ1_9BILA|nr:hypothetical protein WR25_17384 isoform A [Diploscapter pachys]PAV59924.1 hypothetical protein WR25_17384 isoform B [Diploscapter pachys]